MIDKQHCTLFRLVNKIDTFKKTTKWKKLTHGDCAWVGKIVQTLSRAKIVRVYTDNMTNMTDIYLLVKKQRALASVKK